MGITRLGFEYLRDWYLRIFPTQTVDEGDQNFQDLNFMAEVADESYQKKLKIEGFNNPYAQTGDLLVKTTAKFGWSPLLGYVARVRISIPIQEVDFVGEPFTITAYEKDFTAICIAKENSDTVSFLDLETQEPCEFLFLQDLTIAYTGTLPIGEISNLLLLFGGRLPEGDIAFRTRFLSEAITPNQFRLSQSYENLFLEPMPSIIVSHSGDYSLVYPRNSNITQDKLVYLYIGFNNKVPVRSDATEEFIEYELDFSNNVKVTFGVNIYGVVTLQVLVYVQPNITQEDKDKITELLINYSYTPTVNSPIYGKDIIDSLEEAGITSVLAISFVYNGLTHISLTSQGYKDFILDATNPVIIIEEGNV